MPKRVLIQILIVIANKKLKLTKRALYYIELNYFKFLCDSVPLWQIILLSQLASNFDYFKFLNTTQRFELVPFSLLETFQQLESFVNFCVLI